MDNDKEIKNIYKEDSNFEPAQMPINEETARCLRNLAMKSNLTVTTANPAKPPQSVNAEITTNPAKNSNHENNSKLCQQVEIKKEPKMNWKEAEVQKINNEIAESACLNPFAALPLSLIKSGILSVTSDAACVKIENGVPILKETTTDMTTKAALESKVSAAATVTIKAINAKPNNLERSGLLSPLSKAEATTKTLKRKIVSEAKINEKPQTSTSTQPNENAANFAQFQQKLLFQNQILKSLLKKNGVPPVPANSLVPNTNQIEFAALLGLEIATEFCLNEQKPIKKVATPEFCFQCGRDFSPRWYCIDRSTSHKFCERCFIWHLRFKSTEERIEQYKKQISVLRNSLKLTPLTETQAISVVESQQLFKSYLDALSKSGGYCNDRSTGLSDLTKLGASIAANVEVRKAMEYLRCLNSTATPETRAKAIQNLQFAFFSSLNEALKTFDINVDQKNNLLNNYQIVVSHLAQRSGLAFQNVLQPQTGVPHEIFEFAIKDHKQRLLKAIRNAKH